MSRISHAQTAVNTEAQRGHKKKAAGKPCEEPDGLEPLPAYQRRKGLLMSFITNSAHTVNTDAQPFQPDEYIPGYASKLSRRARLPPVWGVRRDAHSTRAENVGADTG